MVIQILLKSIIVIISLYFTLSRLRKFIRRDKSQTLLKLAATVLIWGTILILTIFPGFSREISQLLGFGENLNTLIFIGFVVLFIALYKVLRALENLESLISDIVTKDAVRNAVVTDGKVSNQEKPNH